MSSIHSQASDILPQDPQMTEPQQQEPQQQGPSGAQQQQQEQQQQQQHFDRGKTSAIQKEREEGGNGNMGKGTNNENHKTTPKSDSTKTSTNSSSGWKSLSTITFEKQKVIPPRARTQSAQSVLSAISLQPLFHDHMHQNQQQNHQQQHNGEDQRNSSCTNLATINQQIQSPAMSSIRRKGIGNSTSNGRNSDEDNEIGLRLPFTDDKRLYLDANSVKQRQRQQQKLRESQRRDGPLRNSAMTAVEADAEDDDVVLQKRLTAQALRKLSHLRGSSAVSGNRMVGSDNTTNTANVGNTNINTITTITTNTNANININNNNDNDNDNSNNNSDNGNIDTSLSYSGDDGRTIDATNQSLQAMTHLKFGDKKVFLDSFPQGGNNNNGNGYANLFSQEQGGAGKRSSDVIQQPARLPMEHSAERFNVQQNTGLPMSNARRYVKQINNPKKPLYLPAVLRDVSETNLTNEDFVGPSSPQQSLVSNGQVVSSHYLQQPYQHLNQNTGGSSTVSVHSSSSSSIMETCRRQFALWFFPNGEYSPHRWSPLLDTPVPPTKEHWLSDDKRGSCHYCHKLFTFWERKHHCRHCGDIFCQQHLGHWLYLNSDASFIIGGGGGLGTLSKICDGCLEEYENVVRAPKWKIQGPNGIVQPNLSDQPIDSKIGETAASTIPRTLEDFDVQNDGSFAGSVPADWNWSSF